MKRLYFDHNATASLAPGLADQVQRWLAVDSKNPSSVHQEGQRARAMVEKARRDILRLFGAAPKDQLVFCSGGSEAANTVLLSQFQNRGSKKRLLLSTIEHSCVHNTAKWLEQNGVELDWIDVSPEGHVDLESFQKKLTDDVFLVSVMLANNETGFVLPVAEMASIARKQGVPVHTDAVCAAGKIPLSFEELGCDYLSFSSHKFGALKGCGGVLYRGQAKISPLIHGGEQELGKRAGTENVLGIASTAYALAESLKDCEHKNSVQRELRDSLKAGILSFYPNARVIESPNQLPQTLCVCFVGQSGHLLLTNLDLEGVAASYGSACASGSLEVSRVMTSLGLSMDEAQSALRFSFGHQTSKSDIDELLERLSSVLTRMAA